MPGRRPTGNNRKFDPLVVGGLECDAWASYYRRQWLSFLRAAVGLVNEGFMLGPLRSLAGAWHVLRANQAWAPYPDNDPAAAQARMRRFYGLVARHQPWLDPAQAAMLEIEWWRVHRAHQHSTALESAKPGASGNDSEEGRLTNSLVALYSYLYGVPGESVRAAAELRMNAMALSDRWVAAGCHLADPLLAEERRVLVASYRTLRVAVDGVNSVRA
jgi:hypothetical protein